MSAIGSSYCSSCHDDPNKPNCKLSQATLQNTYKLTKLDDKCRCGCFVADHDNVNIGNVVAPQPADEGKNHKRLKTVIPAGHISLAKTILQRLKSSADASLFSDPTKVQALPFPSLSDHSTRFKLIHSTTFSFQGRKEMSKLVASLVEPPSTQLLICGTPGSGKSHMLAAALSHPSVANHPTRKYVYLHNAQHFMAYPAEYLRFALLVTFADDEEIVSRLQNLDDSELPFFCRKELPPNLVFIIDNYHSLNKTSAAFTFLESCIRSVHRLVMAVSANDSSTIQVPQHCVKLECRSSFDEDEYEAWLELKGFKLFSKPLCHITGTVPLLLREFIDMFTTLTSSDPSSLLPRELSTLVDEALEMIKNNGTLRNVRAHLEQKWLEPLTEVQRQNLKDFLQCAVLSRPCNKSEVSNFDHRYFYISTDRVPCCISDYVRRLVSDLLVSQCRSDFLRQVSIEDIKNAVNASVKGFLLELYILGRILTNQGSYKCLNVNHLPELCHLPIHSTNELLATKSTSTMPILFVPDSSSYPDVDAILLHYEDKTLVLSGIQVTLADIQSHKNSLEKFALKMAPLLSLNNQKITLRFIWICRQDEIEKLDAADKLLSISRMSTRAIQRQNIQLHECFISFSTVHHELNGI